MPNRDRIKLVVVKRTDPPLLKMMKAHYSQPGGFVGRNIVYRISVNDVLYGYTVSGSATRFLPDRDEFLGLRALDCLNRIINNIFYHVERVNGKYPMRNFVTEVIKRWEPIAIMGWSQKYGDDPIAFETLVELPRTGECYKRAGWTKMDNATKGYTCKRVAGKGTDNWTGKRVWDMKNLRPKWVYMKHIKRTVLFEAKSGSR